MRAGSRGIRSRLDAARRSCRRAASISMVNFIMPPYQAAFRMEARAITSYQRRRDELWALRGTFEARLHRQASQTLQAYMYSPAPFYAVGTLTLRLLNVSRAATIKNGMVMMAHQPTTKKKPIPAATSSTAAGMGASGTINEPANPPRTTRRP